MGMFDDANDMAWSAMCDPDSMPGAETATYVKAGPAGTQMPVNVNVTRHPPGPLPGFSGGEAAASFTVFLPAGQGVTSIDTGGDVLILPLRVSCAPKRVPVREILSQDAGGWNLLLY